MQHKTEQWFNPTELEAIYRRYAHSFRVKPVSYATAEDYCESFDHLRPLATYNLDLKDVQRPWVFKSILASVPRGSRILEIGAGEPWVADLLQRLGYQVWVVDPYDGSGNGPAEYEAFSKQCPNIKFIRDQFSDALQQLEVSSFDCIYSISVLEHLGAEGLRSVAAGLKKFLHPNGFNIHVVDHVHRGNGAAAHLANLKLMIDLFDLSLSDLNTTLQAIDTDPETYFLSAESHNRWRGLTPYPQFPMRVCVSIQMVKRT